jgi:hypothetical protein
MPGSSLNHWINSFGAGAPASMGKITMKPFIFARPDNCRPQPATNWHSDSIVVSAPNVAGVTLQSLGLSSAIQLIGKLYLCFIDIPFLVS